MKDAAMVSGNGVVRHNGGGAWRGQIVIVILPAHVDPGHDVVSHRAVQILFEGDTTPATAAKVVAGRQIVDLVVADVGARHGGGRPGGCRPDRHTLPN